MSAGGSLEFHPTHGAMNHHSLLPPCIQAGFYVAIEQHFDVKKLLGIEGGQMGVPHMATSQTPIPSHLKSPACGSADTPATLDPQHYLVALWLVMPG